MKISSKGFVIGIDAMCWQPQGRGIPRYIENIIKTLGEIDDINTYIIFVPGRYVRKANFMVPKANFKYVCCNLSNRWLRLVWQLLLLPLYLKKYKVDVFHATYHVSPLWRGRWRLVVTIHDMVHFIMPHLLPPIRAWYLRKITSLSLNRADCIMPVSVNTKNDIIKKLGINPDKIKVIYHAPCRCFRTGRDIKALKAVKQRYATTDNFILFVGAMEVRKNLSQVIQAFSRFVQKSNTEYRLVIAAQKTREYKAILEMTQTQALRGRVIFAGYVETNELSLLYKAASLVIYPTLYEGFGFPISEAMASGTPVITSDIPAHVEITGDAAKLVNPYDVEEIAQAMLELVSDSSKRAALIEKGFKRAAMFNWESTARETLNVYQDVWRSHNG